MNPQAAEVNTTIQNNHLPQLQNMSTVNTINTGNTELATTASHIEQNVPNEMDSIDPNITQNIANMTADMGAADGDDDDDLDSDNDMDDDDIDDDMDIKNENAQSDMDDPEMVHESVGDDMHHDDLVQTSLSQFENVSAVQSTDFGQTAMDRTHQCHVSMVYSYHPGVQRFNRALDLRMRCLVRNSPEALCCIIEQDTL